MPSHNKILGRFTTAFRHNDFARNVMIMFAGTALGQMGGVIASPVLTRLYDPASFGLLGAFSGVAYMLSCVGALRYEMAMPLSRSAGQAANVLAICLVALAVTTIALFAGVSLIPEIPDNPVFSQALYPYRYALPVAFFLIGLYQVLIYFATYQHDFRVIARTKLYQGIAGPVSQITLGLLHYGPWGLIAGFIVGQSAGSGNLWRQKVWRWPALSKISLRRMRAVARRYRQFPLLSTWPALVSVLGSSSLLQIVVPAMFSAQIAGFLFLTDRIIARPLFLISTSILQVFMGEIGALKFGNPDELRKRFFQLAGAQATIVGAWLLVANLLAAKLIPVLFGEEWAGVVPYLHILSISYFPQMVMHAVSNTLQMLDRQGLNALWEVLRLTLVTLVFGVAHVYGLSAMVTVTLYALCQGAAEIVGFFMMLGSIEAVRRKYRANVSGRRAGLPYADAISEEAPAETSAASPRVSVLIPSYNVADSLETAVRSVLGQTEQSLEILIIDDASTDGTLAVARQLQAQDPRIRVLAMEVNGGKVLAMNRAMAESRGEWIAVLDADDWYAPQRLKVLLDAADRAGVDLVADDWISVDAKAWVYLRSPLPRLDDDTLLDLEAFLQGSRPTSKADYGMLKPILKRSFVTSTGISYHPKARRGQDFYFLLSYFLAGGKALLLKEAYYYYVEPYGAVSRTWAQAGRQRYRFESMIQVNEDFLWSYADMMSLAQMAQLRRRSRGWHDLIAYHELRECILSRRFGDAMRLVMRSTPGFWDVFVRHAMVWMRARLLGPSQEVLGPASNGGTLGSTQPLAESVKP